jgi:hypothetical protein
MPTNLRTLPVFITAFFAFAIGPTPALCEAITWTLTDVQLTNGTDATGSFEYNADTNSVSNVDIVTPLATYTATASTFPVDSIEFAFIPSGTLVSGADLPALLLLVSPGLTDAGGAVSLSGSSGFSGEGAICDDACDGITIDYQVDSGTLNASSTSAVPEPSLASILALVIALIFVFRSGNALSKRSPRNAHLEKEAQRCCQSHHRMEELNRQLLVDRLAID